MIATEDGGYESASDYDDETLPLITSEEHGGDDSDHETQYMAPEDADMYEYLVTQRVLSVQVTQAEQNQRHNLLLHRELKLIKPRLKLLRVGRSPKRSHK